MAIVPSISVLISTLCMAFYVSGSIHSTGTMEGSTDQWINLNSHYGNVVKRSVLNGRLRRASATKLQPEVNEFELQNDTTHNQALIHWSGNGSEVNDSEIVFVYSINLLSLYDSMNVSQLNIIQ